MVYSGPKPKFCSSCGVEIANPGTVSKHAPKRAIRSIPSIREQMEARRSGGTIVSEDETDIDYVPQINGLEYSIADDGSGHNVHKFEDVVNVSAEEKPAKKEPAKKRGRPRKKST